MGNFKAPEKKEWAAGRGEWPKHIADDTKREAMWKRRLKGRRYDEPGMEVHFKTRVIKPVRKRTRK